MSQNYCELIVLDRDGVINQETDAFIKSPEEWHPLPGSLKAIAQLNQWGHRVVVATNQSGVGRGLFSLEDLAAIHAKMQVQLQTVGAHLDGIYFCPHHPNHHCRCRKPKPGLLEKIARDFHCEFTKMIVVGDSLRDLQSAQSVGAKPILVLTGRGKTTQKQWPLEKKIDVFRDLAEFVEEFF